MRHVEADQAWGVTVVAARGSSPALKTGLLPDPRLMVVTSIGVLRRGGHVLLVAALSKDQLSEASGVAQENAVVAAAVREVSASGR